MKPRQGRKTDPSSSEPRHGETARNEGRTLKSFRLGALPLLDGILKRLRLEEFLRDALPPEDPRTKVPTATALLLVLKNLLVSRQPLYGLGEWAARHDLELFGLSPELLAHLNDDRIGRSLDRLFDCDLESLVLLVVTHAVREFGVS
ncbi:DUF4277 domain-containing protein, partial [Singulisphaera rosea]